MIFPFEHGGAVIVDPLPVEEYRARARRIRDDRGFVARLAAVLGRQFTNRVPAREPEEQIYDRFVTKIDQGHCRRWHEIDWAQRDRFAQAVIDDPRLRAFARRMVFEAAPATIAPADRAAMKAWLVDRLLNDIDRPWTTIPAARRRLAELEAACDPNNAERLKHIAEIASWLDAKAEWLDAMPD